MAMYSVPTAAAQSLIDYTGLEILQFRPGRGICVLVFVDYVDGDLGPVQRIRGGVPRPRPPGRRHLRPRGT